MERKKREEGRIMFRFPDIKALVLTTFHSLNDIHKNCTLKLKNYFEGYFKENLAGFLFEELVLLV